jgi:PPOX class probable F420-dependent enzyme
MVNALSELDRHRYMSLSTFRRSGAEVATPVWFAASGGKLYVFTAGDSGKVKRLRHTSRARVAPSDARGRVQGAWRGATSRLVTESQVIEPAHAALRTKYGWQMWLTDLFSRLGGRLQRRAWIEIEVESEAGASTNRHT